RRRSRANSRCPGRVRGRTASAASLLRPAHGGPWFRSRYSEQISPTQPRPPQEVRPMKPDEGTSDLDSLFAAQREAHRRTPFPDWPTRRGRLQRLLRLVLDNQAAIEEAIDADFG